MRSAARYAGDNDRAPAVDRSYRLELYEHACGLVERWIAEGCRERHQRTRPDQGSNICFVLKTAMSGNNRLLKEPLTLASTPLDGE